KRLRDRPIGKGRKKTPEPATTETQAADQAKKKASRPERKPAQRSSRSSSTQRRRTPPRRAPLPAAKRELLVSVDVGEQRVAVLEDDKVAEVYLERPERRSIAGNVYKGAVDNVLPGMEAAFVEIGLEKNGFLYVDEIVVPELEGRRHGKKIQDLISRGQDVLVQAVKDPMKSKGARLTTEISLPGRFVVYVPSGEGLGAHGRTPRPPPREDAADGRLRGRRGDPLDALAPGRPAFRGLPRLRLRRGVHGHRRQHRPLRRLARQGLRRPARGHDHKEQPRGRQGGRPPAPAPRHRRDHHHRLHRHGESEEPRDGRGG